MQFHQLKEGGVEFFGFGDSAKFGYSFTVLVSCRVSGFSPNSNLVARQKHVVSELSLKR